MRFKSENFVTTLCLAGLSEEEATMINNCVADFRALETVDFQAEFMMFFVSWAHQGRKAPFNTIIEDWKNLWSSWCHQAGFFGISPSTPNWYHTTLVEKLYARFPVVYDPSGIKKPRPQNHNDLPTVQIFHTA